MSLIVNLAVIEQLAGHILPKTTTLRLAAYRTAHDEHPGAVIVAAAFCTPEGGPGT